MVRKMVLISETQARRLEQRAKMEGVSMSELFRRGLDIVLETRPRSDEVRKKALSAVGAFSSGDTDVSERHDDYLAEAYSH